MHGMAADYTPLDDQLWRLRLAQAVRDAQGDATVNAILKRAGMKGSYLRDAIERVKGSPRLNEIAIVAEALGKPVSWFIDDAPASVMRVPILSRVSAGLLRNTGDLSAADTEKAVEIAGLSRPHVFALEVDGDSMDRVSPPGSIIIVDMADTMLVEGRAYVFSLRGEATFKQWFDNPPRLEPFSTNPINRTIFCNEDSDFVVIGRVIRTMLDL